MHCNVQEDLATSICRVLFYPACGNQMFLQDICLYLLEYVRCHKSNAIGNNSWPQKPDQENICITLLTEIWWVTGRLCLNCDGTHTETRFRLLVKLTSPFELAGASVQLITGNRGVHISSSNGSNAGYTMFWGSVMSTGYPLHSPLSPSLPLPCETVCHHISTELYQQPLFWC